MKTHMKALRVLGLEGWNLALDTVPVPVTRSGEVLIRTEAVGLCGSDVHACRGDKGYEWLRPPVTLGHEAAGIVVEVGDGVSRDLVGKRVALIAIMGCDSCERCTGGSGNYCADRTCIGLHSNGALAEYFTVPANRVHPVPSRVSSVGAALLEPIAIVQQALEALPADLSGKQIAVSGPGTIGLLSGLECLRRGAEVWVFGNPERDGIRLRFATEIGLKTAHAPESFDHWVEASGAAAALESAVLKCRPQARIVVPALFGGEAPRIDMNLLVRGGTSLHGGYGYLPHHFDRAIDFLLDHEGQLIDMVSRYSLDEAEQALRATAESGCIKAMVVQ